MVELKYVFCPFLFNCSLYYKYIWKYVFYIIFIFVYHSWNIWRAVPTSQHEKSSSHVHHINIIKARCENISLYSIHYNTTSNPFFFFIICNPISAFFFPFWILIYRKQYVIICKCSLRFIWMMLNVIIIILEWVRWALSMSCIFI